MPSSTSRGSAHDRYAGRREGLRPVGDEVKGLSPLGYSLMRPLARPRSALALGAGAITSYSLGPEAFRQIVNSWRDDEAAPHPT